MPDQYSKLPFPIWEFLNQPLFQADSKVILNPIRFCYLHRVRLLERCLQKEYQGRPCDY
jgi:hypothetical protein